MRGFVKSCGKDFEMRIEKNGKTYEITEWAHHWSVEWAAGALSATFRVDKELCPTADDLRTYINENDTF